VFVCGVRVLCQVHKKYIIIFLVFSLKKVEYKIEKKSKKKIRRLSHSFIHFKKFGRVLYTYTHCVTVLDYICIRVCSFAEMLSSQLSAGF